MYIAHDQILPLPLVTLEPGIQYKIEFLSALQFYRANSGKYIHAPAAILRIQFA
jgi:hypothetical protein